MRRPSNPIPGVERRPRIYDCEAAPWPELSEREQLTEKLAAHFGLTYLGIEGIAKLANLLAWARPMRWRPPTVEHPSELVRPTPSSDD